MERGEQIRVFHQRIADAIDRGQHSRAELSRRAGIDRSTLTQLLTPGAGRLPRADTAAAIAGALGVSLDWLLGLSHDDNPHPDILDRAPEIAEASRSPADARLISWHQEATGYKIRYVPANLPDMLKTEEVVQFEYADFLNLNPAQAHGNVEDQLEYARLPESDFEICNSVQSVEMFAEGAGIWRGLTTEARRRQLTYMAAIVDELYPGLRWFLYDGLTTYSSPVTVFGHHRAAIYLGEMYFTFSTTEHVRALTKKFDTLIRNAVVQPTEVRAYLLQLADNIKEG